MVPLVDHSVVLPPPSLPHLTSKSQIATVEQAVAVDAQIIQQLQHLVRLLS
jgi:hypothetical protein